MESDLFDWKDCDGAHECMTFYKPVLKVKVGKFEVGTKFDFANIINTDEGSGLLQFGNGKKLVAEFKLSYKVGEQIT